MQTLSWLFALSLILMAIVSAAATCWVVRARRVRSRALPTDWDITARAVFNTDERRVYRQLRDALPHHIVLAKLPLLRFSQAEDPQRTKYWYRVLGQLNVTFAICGVNGRLLAALDLDSGRTPSQRTLKIKQSVLAACRVRYLRLPVDHLPSIAELQLLVPQVGASARASKGREPRAVAPARASARATPFSRPATAADAFAASSFSPSTFRNPAPRPSTFGDSTFGASTFGPSMADGAPFQDSAFRTPAFANSAFEESSFEPPIMRTAASRPVDARDTTPRSRADGVRLPAGALLRDATPRPARTPLWQDSSFFQDSFFGSDDRPDLSMPSDFGSFDSDLLPAPPAPAGRRHGQPGRFANGHGPYGMPVPGGRAGGPIRRPMRGRQRGPGDFGMADSDIVGVVVDTHDAHRPAARRLLGNRDRDLD